MWGSGTNWDVKKEIKHQHTQQISCVLKKKKKKAIKGNDQEQVTNESMRLTEALTKTRI